MRRGILAALLLSGIFAGAQVTQQSASTGSPAQVVNNPARGADSLAADGTSSSQPGPNLSVPTTENEVLTANVAVPAPLATTPNWRKGESIAFTAEPAGAMILAVKPAPQPLEHRFFDRPNIIAFAVHGATRVADATQSCILLSKPGRRESWLPTQSCGAIAGYSVAMIPAQIGSSYILHRKGHHRLERWLPYAWATPSALGIALSVKAW